MRLLALLFGEIVEIAATFQVLQFLALVGDAKPTGAFAFPLVFCCKNGIDILNS